MENMIGNKGSTNWCYKMFSVQEKCKRILVNTGMVSFLKNTVRGSL